MPLVDFAAYRYYPALLYSTGEHDGYRHLSDADKDRLLPIFEVSQKNSKSALEDAAGSIRAVSPQRSFILDLNKVPAPPPYMSANPQNARADAQRYERELEAQRRYNARLTELLEPAGGFARWREFVSAFPNAVPVIQFTEAANQQRQILQEASLLSRNGCVAVRIDQESGEAIHEITAQILSLVESPEQVLIIVDCGQGRQRISNRAQFVADTISRILGGLDVTERPLVRAVCMSNSFTQPPNPGLSSYDNLDRRLWQEASDAFPFIFGDYGANYRRPKANTFVPSDWRATVVLPRENVWSVYRHENSNDPAGWQQGAGEIVEAHADDIPDTWGGHLIRRAAAADMNGIDSPRFWLAAKTNIHIHKQLAVTGPEDTLEDDSED